MRLSDGQAVPDRFSGRSGLQANWNVTGDDEPVYEQTRRAVGGNAGPDRRRIGPKHCGRNEAREGQRTIVMAWVEKRKGSLRVCWREGRKVRRINASTDKQVAKAKLGEFQKQQLRGEQY